ncbi:hypothetical protein PGT21_005327 [Puccinia graminis f. sp. tritici]|uniref:Uncharacterized protein n=1 Tax=Puccinia graminis f. sp. tritici TaxID=56615 RepID=A0A5B0MEM3_PUCGR|nr:hypothetical protein PGT21_005327 [Puccinia graminis f. sp. tritici]
MQLSSILCAFHLFNCYVISAHPTLYPKAVGKRGINDVSVGTEIHLLHKRMENSSRELAKDAKSGTSSNKHALEAMFRSMENVESGYSEMGDKIDKIGENLGGRIDGINARLDRSTYTDEKKHQGSKK